MGYGKKLKITNTHLHGCEYMWEGINSDVGTELYLDNVLLQDAYKGTLLIGFPPQGARFQIYNTTFNNNLVAAEIRNLIGNSMLIQNSIFTSRQISTSPTYFPTVNQLKANNESLLMASSEASLKAPMAAIGRSYCGIFTHQMMGLWIDGGSASTSYNLFDRLGFGVISFMARTKVTNCHFQNMAFASGKPPFPMNYLPNPGLYNSPTLVNQGVGIVADGISAPDFFLHVGDGQPIKSCIFKNCASAGISISSLREKRILLNQFSCDANISAPIGGNYGIKIMNDNFGFSGNYAMKTHLISNRITNAKHAIACYQAGIDYNFADLKIFYNLIDGTAGTGIEVAATNTNFYPGPSSNNYPIDKTIFSNTILNTQTGIKLSNIKVIPGVSNTHFYVNNNTITLSPVKTGFTASIGINLISCQYIDVLNNIDISGNYSLPVTTPYHAAIKNTNSPNCMVQCNTVHHVDQAYVFEGTCLPTVFTNNYMSNCYDGVVLNYAGIIGTQGLEGMPSDNFWATNSSSFTNSETIAYNSFGNQSPFFVRAISGYIPIVNLNNNGVSILLYNANGPFYQCSNSSNSFHNNEHDELERLAGDSSYFDAPPESNFLKDKLIFDKMTYDSLFADTASQQLLDYYQIISGENVGLLGESERLFRNRDYLQAKLLATAITPVNAAEIILQSTIVSYCNWLLDSNYVFSVAEIENLKLVAAHCPALYGDAVGIARTLLIGVVGDETTYEPNCNEANTAMRKAFQIKKQKSINPLEEMITISPNPANDFLNIVGNEQSIRKIAIMDLNGKNVLEKLIPVGEISVDLSAIQSGVYYYSVKINNQIESYGKLIVINY